MMPRPSGPPGEPEPVELQHQQADGARHEDHPPHQQGGDGNALSSFPTPLFPSTFFPYTLSSSFTFFLSLFRPPALSSSPSILLLSHLLLPLQVHKTLGMGAAAAITAE